MVNAAKNSAVPTSETRHELRDAAWAALALLQSREMDKGAVGVALLKALKKSGACAATK